VPLRGLFIARASELRRTAAPFLLDAAPRRASISFGARGASWDRAMPLPRRLMRIMPPIGQRRCPACGHLLFLQTIEPSEKAGEDTRAYECIECAYSEAETVQFRWAILDLLAPRLRRRRASCLSADKRHRQIFADQDGPDVSAIVRSCRTAFPPYRADTRWRRTRSPACPSALRSRRVALSPSSRPTSQTARRVSGAL